MNVYRYFLHNLLRVINCPLIDKFFPSIAVQAPTSLFFQPSQTEISIIADIYVNRLSMTPPIRLFNTYQACKHVHFNAIKGSFVECGVWRGGHAILASRLFAHWNDPRTIHLYDTFDGMTQPTHYDFEIATKKQAVVKQGTKWLMASMDEVKRNFEKHGDPRAEVVFVKGDITQTLVDADCRPLEISVLRLDTDWYESTAASLDALYPRLSTNGVLIIDDYGHWGGAKRATDEYFSLSPVPLFNFADYTCISATKPSAAD